jgi:hypothetical protein
VDANPAASTRTGTIQLAAQTFTVSQVAAACNYSVNPYAVLWHQAGGNGTIQASPSATTGCTPSASVNQPFVLVTTPTGPVSDSFTESYTVSPFVTIDSQVRRATILFGGQSVLIKQTSW